MMWSGSIGSGCWPGRSPRWPPRKLWKRSTSRPRSFRCRSRRVCRRGGGGWGSRIRSVSRPRRPRRRRRAGWRTRGCWSTEMPAALRALAAGRVSRAGCAGGDHGDAVSDPGGPWPGRHRARSGGGVDVGARDQPGGAAAGDRTRPGRRRPPGSTGPGGPVRVHPTPAGHHGHDHRGPAGGTSRGVFRVTTRRRGISESDRGRTDQRRRSRPTPSSNGSPARPPRLLSRSRSSW